MAVAATYSNGLSHPLIFDDQPSIAGNAELQAWPDMGRVLASAPLESPFAGRPVVTLTFALNYAMGGSAVLGFRLTNIALHAACALLFFGLVRRTLATRTDGLLSERSAEIACVSALLWAVHPLNSEVVDYLTQRTESLMALFAFGTLYAGLRAHDDPRRSRLWLSLGIVACMLGMASKETMVTVPVLVVLYDRIFVLDTWRAVFKARWHFYAGLAATWVVLGALMWSNPRTSSTGFASAYVSAWGYLLDQTVMITRYLWLTIWPRSLVLYYGWATPTTLGQVWPYAVFLTLLFGAAVVALVRWPRAGFLGAWFFVTLAPSSSIVPIASEVGAERRMYLPLAALIVLSVVSVVWLWESSRRASALRTAPKPARSTARGDGRRALLAGAIASLALTTCLAAGTYARTREYSSSLTMARTLGRWPSGAADHILGTELILAGQRDEGIAYLRKAMDRFPLARFDLGIQLFQTGRYDEAIDLLRRFCRDEPRLVHTRRARLVIGQALGRQGRWREAIQDLRRLLAASPNDVEAQGLLADAYLNTGAMTDAIAAYEVYLRANPGKPDALQNMAIALVQTGRIDDAIQAFRQVARSQPDNLLAAQNLVRALLDRGDVADAPEATSQARRVVMSIPGDADARELLARALELAGDRDGAREEFRRLLVLDPSSTSAREGLRRLSR